MAIGHRQRHKKDGGDETEQQPQNSTNHNTFLPGQTPNGKPQLDAGRLMRSRSSLPVLKNGTYFSSTGTGAPVRGLRPIRGALYFTVNAPKPLSSTRSPRANALTISSKMTLTIRSTSRGYRCGLAAAILC